jgi:hypothetical protein
MAESAPLAETEIRAMAEDWYRKLDVHVPVEEILPMLADKDLEMHFPEGIMRGHEGFKEWYKAVTHRFFDEVHTVKEVTATPAGTDADVKVVVNWQAKIWDPPAANSVWLGFDAYQTWVVRRSPETKQPIVVKYVVDELKPMPGSGSL